MARSHNLTDDELWDAYERDRTLDARNALVVRYLPIARKLAARKDSQTPASVTFDDLFSWAVGGLMTAVERYERARGKRFEAFCPGRISGAMLDGLREIDWAPRLARSRGDVIPEMGSLFHPLGHVESDSGRWTLLVDTLVDPGAGGALERYEAGERFNALLRGCNKATRLLVVMYYAEGLTLREIGESLGLSESRVSQMHTQFLRFARLRAGLPMEGLLMMSDKRAPLDGLDAQIEAAERFLEFLRTLKAWRDSQAKSAPGRRRRINNAQPPQSEVA